MIDAAALSYEKVDDEEVREGSTQSPLRARRAPPAPRGVALAPAFGPRKEGGFDVGVGGAF